MKMLSCLFFGALTYFSSPALSGHQNPQTPSPLPIQGRIGVGGALEYMSTEANLKVKSPTSSAGNVVANESQIAKKLQVAPCLEFGLTIGNAYYLGLHVSWRQSGAKNTSKVPFRDQYQFLHIYKMNSYFDVLAKAGYKLTPQIMVYGSIGPSFANLSHTTQQIFINPTTGDETLINQFKTTRNSVGLGLGGGLEYLIQSKYAISFDCTYHAHRSATETKGISYLQPGPGASTRTRSGDLRRTIRPSYSTVSLRFTYFFSVF